jgi:hypothetical protein
VGTSIRGKVNPLNHANGVPKELRRCENEEEEIDVDASKFAKLDDEERLQKVIARAGVASRRDAERMVRNY